MVSKLAIKEQHAGGRQTKISDVFTPCSSTNFAGPSKNTPRVSSSPATLELNMKMAIRQ